MARVLITGSSDGLGFMTGQLLVNEGHSVTLHARNEDRAGHAREMLPRAEHVVVGDVANLSGMRSVAEQANSIWHYDAVIHNVGVGYRDPIRRETDDGLCYLFAVNVLAPYVLTALISTRRNDSCISARACTKAETPTFRTCSGYSGSGMARRPIRTRSCSMWCWPSPSRDVGRRYGRTPSNRDGCRRRWADPTPPTTSHRGP